MYDLKVINRMQEMCEESLDPETFAEWEKVKELLYRTRHSLKVKKVEDALLSKSLQALCFTYDYVGEETLPAIKGWSWYDSGMEICLHIPADEWAIEFMKRVRSYQDKQKSV